MDIFVEKRLFPQYGSPIKQHYQDYFDTVFIAFVPFFKLKSGHFSQEGSQKSRRITFEQAQAADEIFREMPKPAAQIFAYDNPSYPNDEEMYLHAERVSWNEVKEGCAFESFRDVNKALKTSIGAYRKAFQRPDLAGTLSAFTKAHQIYHPTEGHFDALSKKEIFKGFHLLEKTDLYLVEQFCLDRKELDISAMIERAFVEAVNFKYYYAHDVDKQLLFAIDWDDFFFLICSSKEHVNRLVSTLQLEGFYCDDTTELAWELTNSEMEEGVRKEQMQKATAEANGRGRKSWWKFW